MAWIKTYETKDRKRGKRIRTYRVIWKETRRDDRGLPIPASEANPSGRKRSTNRQRTFADREAAEQFRDEINAQKHQPGGVVVPRDQLFAHAADAWLASRTDLKPRTRGEYENLLSPKKRARKDANGNSTAHLSIIATFGGKAVGSITRQQIAEWVQALIDAGKKPSAVRHAYFVVKMVLEQAVADGLLRDNPADHVKMPSERTADSGTPGVVDDPDSFLTADQVSALVAATPWPYNVLVHVAAWSGLRAAELGGLQVGDLELPARQVNPNARPKPGTIRVDRTLSPRPTGGYDTPKTRGSRRRVPLTSATVDVLRDYLALHPRSDEPTAPLFPAFRLTPPKQTGVRAADEPETAQARATRQADALAALTVDDAEQRLDLDWSSPVRHQNFYKAVFRPAVLRAGTVPLGLKFHALRHTYASLCVAAGIPPLEIARFMGHAKVTTTLSVYAHLFEDDHTDAMHALSAMGTPTTTENVVRLRR
ncbi:tyrosine-type recombinase/integrase [Gordonia alkanivorans]|uniref:tyrosine-type recombinase/integrase n=1 Tax=Gordonia alkanivorans TaxID=84096 RepID=UPI00244CA34F|nr:site-specific integrase [Gordonia alkanivorans]MDH3022670.1 site-specific integrase [Gordonia alkanivorans]MDJ0010370.1 site-specific integrase [Gordonia alkanivorans]MDJ0100216.1 site-specific integrase [Gordonia alkanivorans]MDJ0496003.1 site-specific integrase [Gordonia alkanivorans]